MKLLIVKVYYQGILLQSAFLSYSLFHNKERDVAIIAKIQKLVILSIFPILYS